MGIGLFGLKYWYCVLASKIVKETRDANFCQ
jgi:hypothetical protein